MESSSEDEQFRDIAVLNIFYLAVFKKWILQI